MRFVGHKYEASNSYKTDTFVQKEFHSLPRQPYDELGYHKTERTLAAYNHHDSQAVAPSDLHRLDSPPYTYARAAVPSISYYRNEDCRQCNSQINQQNHSARSNFSHYNQSDLNVRYVASDEQYFGSQSCHNSSSRTASS